MAREGSTMSRLAGRRRSAVAARALVSGSRRRARSLAISAPASFDGRLVRPPQLGLDLRGKSNVFFSPKPIRAGARNRNPSRDALRADDHGPVLAIGVGGARTRQLDVYPGNQSGILGHSRLDFAQAGDLARQGTIILDQLGLKLAQCDAGQCPLAFQVFESLGPPGLVKFLGCRFDQFVEPFQLAGQFAEAGALAGCQPLVLASGQLIEQASAEVLFQALPRVGGLTEPGLHSGQGGAHCWRPSPAVPGP